MYANEKKFYLAAFLAPVVALTFYSCIKDPEWGRTLESSQLEAEEAKAFFERYAASLPMDLWPVGITPGNFAPEWGKAIPTSSGGVDYLNIPIVAEHAYEGYFARDYTQTPDGEEGYYHTAIAQKLVVAREETGKFSCAVATIIPAESRATRSSSEVLRMFYCGGANAKFSGVVMYSTLEDGGYTLCVDRYHEGSIAARRDVYSTGSTDADNAKAMAALVGAAKVSKKKVAVRTKSQESSGGLYGVNELPEVVVTAPSTGGNGGSIYWWPSTSISSGGGGGGSSGGSSGGSGGGGGGGGGSSGGGSSSSGGNSSNPSTSTKKVAFDKSKYPGYVSHVCDCKCVADKIMKIVLGNNANIGSPANSMQLWKEVNGVMTKVGDANAVFNTLRSHIDANRPIEVGVDHSPRHTGNLDNTTDHWVVVTGYGWNAVGGYYFNYIETARYQPRAAEATSDNLRFYYNAVAGTFTDLNAYREKEYTITQIRPNQ